VRAGVRERDPPGILRFRSAHRKTIVVDVGIHATGRGSPAGRRGGGTGVAPDQAMARYRHPPVVEVAVSDVYLHLLLNHVPTLGALFAALLLAWGLARRHDAVVRAGLGALVLAALAGVGTYYSGQAAEEEVERLHLPGVTHEVVEAHEEAGRIATIALGVVGLAALLALLRSRRTAARGAATAVLLLAVVSVGILSWAASLGGRIRHTEIRQEKVPLPEGLVSRSEELLRAIGGRASGQAR